MCKSNENKMHRALSWFVSVVIAMAVVCVLLGSLISCSTTPSKNSQNTEEMNIPCSVNVIDKKMADPGKGYNDMKFYLLDVEFHGTKHQYVLYWWGSSSGWAHWEDCAYCKEKALEDLGSGLDFGSSLDSFTSSFNW